MTESERQQILLKLQHSLRQSGAKFMDRVPAEIMDHLFTQSQMVREAVERADAAEDASSKLRWRLNTIKAFVCGDACTNGWNKGDFQVTANRGRIADLCEHGLPAPIPQGGTGGGEQGAKGERA